MLDVAELDRKAMAAEDTSAFAKLLDPNVTWGAPGVRNPTCKNRNQVLSWHERAKAGASEGASSASKFSVTDCS
jgi:hypothetical protein